MDTHHIKYSFLLYLCQVLKILSRCFHYRLMRILIMFIFWHPVRIFVSNACIMIHVTLRLNLSRICRHGLKQVGLVPKSVTSAVAQTLLSLHLGQTVNPLCLVGRNEKKQFRRLYLQQQCDNSESYSIYKYTNIIEIL